MAGMTLEKIHDQVGQQRQFDKLVSSPDSSCVQQNAQMSRIDDDLDEVRVATQLVAAVCHAVLV